MFKNIKAGIVIVSQKELLLSVNGERLNDYEDQFNDLYFERINQLLNHKEWGIFFKQIDESIPKFIVDIFTDSQNDYALIHNTITSYPARDIKFELMSPYWGFQEFLSQSGQQFPE